VSTSIDELFAEVYANPDDDQLRRVLSDALMAAGDPRGELILFQLEPDKDYHRRAMRLIQAHGLSWLGPLRGFVIPLAYERGFVAAVQLLTVKGVDWDHPMWATIHTIDVGTLDNDELLYVRLTPAMRSLTALRGLTDHRREILRNRNSLDRLRVVLDPVPGDIRDVSDDEHYDAVDE
jgi:uncharacterized protein (TIGR02996 family)